MSQSMKKRFRLFKRGWGTYYVEDTTTGKQASLKTSDIKEAERLLHAKCESKHLPSLSAKIARIYWEDADPMAKTRTWQYVIDQLIQTKKGENQKRWKTVAKDKALSIIRHVLVIETQAEHFLDVLKTGTVSTNLYLRRIHNFALDMNWLGRPVIAKRQWPQVRYKERRAITLEEHVRVVNRERNAERRVFYQLLWHLGASQSDLALLNAEDINWDDRLITYRRRKTGQLARLHFGKEVEGLLGLLPTTGPLFPYLATVRSCDRATEFKQRCEGLNIKGVTLHCYRYAWAERARKCGYPERWAQEALGHGSKAVHRAYAKNAMVQIPSMEDYEQSSKSKVIALEFKAAAIPESGAASGHEGTGKSSSSS